MPPRVISCRTIASWCASIALPEYPKPAVMCLVQCSIQYSVQPQWILMSDKAASTVLPPILHNWRPVHDAVEDSLGADADAAAARRSGRLLVAAYLSSFPGARSLPLWVLVLATSLVMLRFPFRRRSRPRLCPAKHADGHTPEKIDDCSAGRGFDRRRKPSSRIQSLCERSQPLSGRVKPRPQMTES